jgi:hypothetical protein
MIQKKQVNTLFTKPHVFKSSFLFDHLTVSNAVPSSWSRCVDVILPTMLLFCTLGPRRRGLESIPHHLDPYHHFNKLIIMFIIHKNLRDRIGDHCIFLSLSKKMIIPCGNVA